MSPLPRMKEDMCWVAWVLLLGVLMSPRVLNGMQLVTIKRGRSVTLPCAEDAGGAYWTWEPRFPKCAGATGEKVVLYPGGLAGQEPPARFRHRLSRWRQSLVLSEATMSDSGVFRCHAASGMEQSTDLLVEGGCFKNVSITFSEQKFQRPTLFCKACPRSETAAWPAFSWTVNGEPHGDIRLGKPAVKLPLDPAGQKEQGRWRCTSLENPEWQAEYCWEPAAVDYIPPADMEADDDALPEMSQRPLFLAFVVAGAVFALSLAAILCACYLERKSRDGEKEQAPEEELEVVAGPLPPDATVPASERRPSGPRTRLPENRDAPKKTSDGLLYAQLDHFPIKPDAKRPPPGERATIYATIV